MKNPLTRSLTRMAEHCSGTPIILWGFQVTELALYIYWTVNTALRVCVCVCNKSRNKYDIFKFLQISVQAMHMDCNIDGHVSWATPAM